ncbi:MAG TPA: hypothetical protein VFA26_00895, partial [Gemmataceae bacterium]|nr:hypothetical protein [Gemmataceae bacterium]
NSRQAGKCGGVDGDRDNAAYIDSLGWVLFRRGRLGEARKELERAAALPDGRDDPVVWDHLGDVRFRQKDLSGAREAWRTAVKLYEEGRRRASDPRFREIKQKLQLPELQAQQP